MGIFFLVQLFFIIYPYLIYPLLLTILSELRRRRSSVKESSFYSVSMVIAAHNEEKVIGRKIENSLSLNYPKEKLEIIVVSDCSTDATDEVAASYRQQGVVLISRDQQEGKSAAINIAVPKTIGEIILFTDANAMLDKNALKNMVRHFSDPAIGFVTGKTEYVSPPGHGKVKSTGTYTRLETFIKKQESILGSCVGADGALFAIRKKLFKPLKPTDINDLVVPLTIIGQGYRGVLDEESFCIEDISANPQDEYNRQVRITARTLKAIFD